jgi:hypothetical protein
MATARELLEQADALMRRNRLRDAAGEHTASGIPMLTEVVGPFDARPERAPAAATGEGTMLPNDLTGAATATAVSAVASPAGNDAARDFDDVPLLTDVVADLEPISVLGAPQDAGEPSQWPDVAAPEVYADRWMASGPADAPVPAPDDTSEQLPAGVPDGPIGGGDDAARWAALAEEVRMQVLQRIDIFTDTGLQEQLTARLQPIVDRASADLVATINQQVGQLLRAYVAEAIEREIDKWRQDGA